MRGIGQQIAEQLFYERRNSSQREFSIPRLSAEFSRILEANDLSARLVVEGRAVTVGRSNTAKPVEFIFASRDIFERTMTNLGLYGFARVYLDGALDIHGSMDDAVEVLYAINTARDRRRTLFERLRNVAFRAAKATLPLITKRFESDAHYSMSAEAYALFLDTNMQYTCGKFFLGTETIDEAQTNKFELIARLAQSQLGRLAEIKHLDFGCGWGGLVSHFQKNYLTQSVGITNNESQFNYAKEHFGADVILGDFSELFHSSERYDLISIVGMAEHLTPRRRSALFEKAKRLLRDGGLIYFQCIAKPKVWIGGDAYRIAFSDVFPGHYLETSEEMELRFRDLGFEICYASDDAFDYARTTALWAKNLHRNRVQISSIVGERNFRVFFGYLSYASKLFASERGSLMRYMLRKPLNDN